MIRQPAPSNKKRPPAIAQMIAAACDALRQAGGEAQSAVGATADPLDLDERLRRIRTRLD